MKILHKIIVFFVLLITVMLVIPSLFTLAPPDLGMAAFMIFFFFICPIFSVFVGYITASNLKRLFWMPIVEAISFPLLFSIVVGGFVPELYVYSVIYLLVACLMVGVRLAMRAIKNWEARNTKDE